MKDAFKNALELAASNLPFIVGTVVIGQVCKMTKSATPLWALILLPKFTYRSGSEKKDEVESVEEA